MIQEKTLMGTDSRRVQMVNPDNKYTRMQKEKMNAETKRMSIQNHRQHDSNPMYWSELLGDVSGSPEGWKDKVALDFGCGCGRNVINLLNLADWKRVDGIDISENNIDYCKKHLKDTGFDSSRFGFFSSNGIDVNPLKNDEYDFIMSTIVLQHICVYDIRFSILKDIYRVLKPRGLFSFQMIYGPYRGDERPNYPTPYHGNYYDATDTNSAFDTTVSSPSDITNDLDAIGFTSVSWKLGPAYYNEGYDHWIYVKARKD